MEKQTRQEAVWSLRLSLEAERMRAREEAAARLAEADGQIVAALSALLIDAWMARLQLAQLQSPIHVYESPFHSLMAP